MVTENRNIIIVRRREAETFWVPVYQLAKGEGASTGGRVKGLHQGWLGRNDVIN